MIPQVSSVFLNWTEQVQMKVIQKEAVDLELSEKTLAVVTYEAVMQPMPPQKVERKPEGLRTWKWWESWSTTELEVDTVVQDPAGVQYRVQSKQDWSQGGFFHYEMTEEPRGL